MKTIDLMFLMLTAASAYAIIKMVDSPKVVAP